MFYPNQQSTVLYYIVWHQGKHPMLERRVAARCATVRLPGNPLRPNFSAPLTTLTRTVATG